MRLVTLCFVEDLKPSKQSQSYNWYCLDAENEELVLKMSL